MKRKELSAGMRKMHEFGPLRRLGASSSLLHKCIILMFLFPPIVLSADSSFLSRINFRQFRPEDGLPNAQVRRILQDHAGFMWFATFDGLVRFDSHEFRTYRHDSSDPKSISNNVLWDIAEDRQRNIWIGTDSGLDLWRRATEDFIHFGLGKNVSMQSSSIPVRRILLEEDKCLWIGTSESGIYRMDLKTGQFLNFQTAPKNPNSLSDNNILDLYKDAKGMLWIATQNGGLNQFNPTTQQFQIYKYNPKNPRSLGSNQVSSIGEDLQGALWVGTNAGLSRLDRERGAFENYPFDPDNPAAPQGNKVDAIFRDREGRMWFGTDGGGLSRFEPATRSFVHFQNIKNDSSTLLSDTITAICQDRNGDLWIGHVPTGTSFANRLNAFFQLFRSNPYNPNSLPDDNIHSVLEDASGNIWVGTNKAGLCYYKNSTKKWMSYANDPKNPNSLSANTVMALCRDYFGNIWAGTWKGGVDRFDPRTRQFRHFRPDSGNNNTLGSAFVFGIVEDLQHRIWIATYGGGVDRYDPSKNQFARYRHDPSNPHSINHDTVYCIMVSRTGEVWAGTHAGLAKWNPSSDDWQRYQSRPGQPGSLSHNLINDILEDREGNLWVATNGGGLNHLNIRTGKFESFGVKEGLPSALVRSLLEDQQGILWMGTAEGLVCFNPQNRHIRVYDKSTGMEGLFFNRNSCWRRQNGELMFGGNKALNIFDPRMVPLNDVIPPVAITGLEIDGRPDRPGQKGSFLKESIVQTEQLSIPSRIAAISFQFAALNFRSPERNQYLFKLEGFDQSWRKAGSEQRATYTNLNPGTYHFRVKASNNEGLWNNQGATLKLVVVPAWWQTVWFKAGIAGFIALMIAVASWILSNRRFRLKLMEARREKEHLLELQKASTALKESEERLAQAQKIESVGRLAGGIAHDLNNMLTPILGHCELLTEDMPVEDPRRESLNEISRAAEHSRDLLRQLLAFARRQTLEMKILDLNQVIQNFEQILRRTLRENILIEMALAPGLPAVRGDVVQIEQILVNLAVNAQDAMPNGGSLIIGTNTRHVGSEESQALDIVVPGNYVVLTVSDTGIGMDKETQNRVFEPFFTTKDSGKGTGLGLATVYGIVKQHGAFIHLYSEQGAGTVFRIFFPMQAEKPVSVAQGEAVATPSPPAGSETILLVEDQVQVKDLCLRFLAKAGYQVLAAQNAAEALNCLEQHPGPIHLLLTDVVLPDINGKSLYQQIASQREGIRVLYMSGYTADVITHHGVLDEGMHFIQKPFSSQALKEKIIQVLHK